MNKKVKDDGYMKYKVEHFSHTGEPAEVAALRRERDMALHTAYELRSVNKKLQREVSSLTRLIAVQRDTDTLLGGTNGAD